MYVTYEYVEGLVRWGGGGGGGGLLHHVLSQKAVLRVLILWRSDNNKILVLSGKQRAS